jgi:hypothetical protein
VTAGILRVMSCLIRLRSICMCCDIRTFISSKDALQALSPTLTSLTLLLEGCNSDSESDDGPSDLGYTQEQIGDLLGVLSSFHSIREFLISHHIEDYEAVGATDPRKLPSLPHIQSFYSDASPAFAWMIGVFPNLQKIRLCAWDPARDARPKRGYGTSYYFDEYDMELTAISEEHMTKQLISTLPNLQSLDLHVEDRLMESPAELVRGYAAM